MAVLRISLRTLDKLSRRSIDVAAADIDLLSPSKPNFKASAVTKIAIKSDKIISALFILPLAAL